MRTFFPQNGFWVFVFDSVTYWFFLNLNRGLFYYVLSIWLTVSLWTIALNPLATENWYYSASSLLHQESILPWLSRLLVGTFARGNLVFWPGIGEEERARGRGYSGQIPSHGDDRSMFFSWFENILNKLAVALLKYSKYSFFFGLNFRFHGSLTTLGIRGSPPV